MTMTEHPEQQVVHSDPFERDLHKHVIQSTTSGPLPEANRGSWYCPTVTKHHARALEQLCEDADIGKVYDLGAGDLRLSIWMAQRGFDVVAYETITKITDAVSDLLDTSEVDIRNRDYYADWDSIRTNRAAFVAFGAMNKIPAPAPEGIVVEGYSEIGYNALIDGRRADKEWFDLLTSESSEEDP